MSRVQVELDEEILTCAERLARQRGVSIEQLFADLLDQASKPSAIPEDQVLGLFGDEPDLMDQVTEDALGSREQPLRLADG